MIWQRLLTAFFGVPLILIIFYLGGIPLLLFSIAIVLIGLYEFFDLMGRMEFTPVFLTGYIVSIFILLGTYYNLRSYLGLFLWLVILLFFWHFIAEFPRVTLQDIGVTLLGVYYVAGLYSYLLWVRFHLAGGLTWALLVLLLTWTNDTASFFLGTRFGKKRLCPRLSPKKSVEGAFGGLIFTVFLALVFAGFTGAGYGQMALLGVLAAALGTTGDLIESALKRSAHTKDSGTFLPGHGGVLDRLDSLLLVAPLVYYYLQLFKLS
ncbi:MAG TPA: phosphatidate cytidylyltransferase [Clostridia bacterium]|nr:phosphatidate cytidylyltransferase [Clostridia bacterium]